MRLVITVVMIAAALFTATARAATPVIGGSVADARRTAAASIRIPVAAAPAGGSPLAALVSQWPDTAGAHVTSEIIGAFGLVTEHADDFILPGASATPVQLTAIRWWGGYFNTGSPSFPHVSSFTLAIYADAGCVAGTEVAELDVDGNAGETFFAEPVPGEPRYAYATPVSIELLAGKRYWLSIRAGDHPFPPQWGRLAAAGPVTDCQSLFRSEFFGFPSWTPIGDVFGSSFDASQVIEGGAIGTCAGLPHFPLGASTVTADGDSLVMTGIGASGEDGFGIDLEYMTGLEFLFANGGFTFDAVADSGAELNLTLHMEVPPGAMAKQGEPIRGVDVNFGKKPAGGVTAPIHVTHRVDFSALGATAESILIVNGGVVQYRAWVPNGTEVKVYESSEILKAIKENGIGVTSDWNGDGVLDSSYTAVAFQFSDPFPMEVEGMAVTGDRIVFSRHDGESAGEAFELRVRARALRPGSALEGLSIKGIRPLALGGAFAATGDTRFAALPAPPGAASPLHAMAPPGGDVVVTQGAPIAGMDFTAVGIPGGTPVAALGAALADPGMGLAPGAALTLHADGIVAGAPGAALGWCSFEMMPTALLSPSLQLTANFASLGATRKRIEVRNGAVLVHTGTTISDTVATSSAFPAQYGYDVAATQGTQAGYVLHWSSPTTIRVAGIDYVADELRIGMDEAMVTSVVNPSAVAHLRFQGQGIPELTFTATTSAGIATGVAAPADPASREPLRLAAWPNPSASTVEFRVSAPAGARLSLDIFDVAGRHVRTLAAGAPVSGTQALRWDARSDAGGAVSAGVYFVRGTVHAPGMAGQRVDGRFVIVR